MSDSIEKYEDDLYWKSNTTNGQTLRRYPGDIKVMIHESPDGGKTVKSRPFREPKQDSYVQRVKDKFEERSQTGIRKYNTTLDRTDLNLLDWLTHLQEELMDATLYVERLKDEVTKKG